ncbi:GMC family oxidoreductase [Bradyrhizobium sp. STM 3562]|uniref:GMC family oxidoreductase n=1 Tax=Bradyrhizobium sp. STM 3562 TaxID=578924 RepID=UPI00388F22A7
MLGGSSSINAMLWYRGHRSDYDAWEAAGATGWNFASVLPYFKRTEDWEGGASEFRGAGGPLRIERPRDPHPIARAMLDAAAELGFPVIDDPNGASNEGASLPNLNIGGGKRWSAARGYLHPLADRPNLTVRTHALALGLGFDGRRCRTVRFIIDGVVTEVRAEGEVILALGAIDTPRLLLMCGIGPAGELERLGVPVLCDLRGVGENLQDHPLLMGINFRARRPLGPVRDNGGGAIMNWKSTPALAAPDLHAFVVQGAHAGAEVASAYDLSGDIFAMSPGLMRSTSVGRLRLQSAAPGGALDIQPNFLAESGDMEALIAGMDAMTELASTKAFADLVAGPAAPDRRLSRREKIAYIRMSCSTFFHPCGTCAMGEGERAVVDPQLRVRGVDGLRIADASVIPIIPSCNTHAPVVMIGERAADFITGTKLATKTAQVLASAMDPA